MSNKYHEPWTTREKVELLVNVLHGQHQDLVSYLVQIIHENRIAPQWTDIPLPEGRSLRASQLMFDNLSNNQRPPQSYPPSVTHLASPYPPSMSQPRMFTEPPQLQSLPRPIQPRPSRSTDSPIPASTNGEGLTIVRTIGPDFGNEIRRKKRGRPTKEEAEERDRALAAEGKVYEPKKRPSKKFRASTGTPVPVAEAPLTGSPPISTPASQAIQAKEDSSSGKRRLRRQGSLLLHPPAHPMSPQRRGGDEQGERTAESPSDRLLARFSERGSERTPSGGEASLKLQPPITTGP